MLYVPEHPQDNKTGSAFRILEGLCPIARTACDCLCSGVKGMAPRAQELLSEKDSRFAWLQSVFIVRVSIG